MPKNLSVFEKPPISSTSSLRFSPIRILASLAVLIYLAELITMILLYFIQLPNYWANSLLDGLIMIVLILPGLYWLQLKPLVREMDERAQAVQALHAKENLLEKVLELLPVGVWILDEKGKITHGNPTSLKIWGGARYVGLQHFGEYKGWWADTGKQIGPDEWPGSRAITHGETSINDEIDIEAFDGARKTILHSTIPILDEQKVIQGAVIVNQDITARRQTQQALIQSNELLERFFSSIGVLIAYMDRDFYFIRVNDAYAHSAGHPPEFFRGKNYFDLYPHPENKAIFQRVVDTGEPFSIVHNPFEFVDYPERGMTYWDWSLQPVNGSNGNIQGLVLSLINITDRIYAESKLTQQNKELLNLTESERKLRALAESLVQAVITLSSSLQPEEVLNSVLDQIQRSISFQSADIVLIEDGEFRIAAYRGLKGTPEGVADLQTSYAQNEFSLIRRICVSHQPMLVTDTLEAPNWPFTPGMEWVRSYLAAPLIRSGRVIGVINLTSNHPGYFNQDDLERLVAFAAPAALALHNAHLYKAESNARQAAETLSVAVQSLTQTLDVDQIINSLLKNVDAILPADVTGIALLEGEARIAVRSVLSDEHWVDKEKILSSVFNADSSPLLRELLLTHKSVSIPDRMTAADWQEIPGLEHIRCWLGVPLVAGERVIGVVGIGKVETGNFPLEQIQWAEILAGQAAMAIQNAWLFEQVCASSERLQSLARKLVELQESERFHIARELHDEAGQALSSLKLSLTRLEQDPGCPEPIRQRLLELKNVVDSVLEELHRLAMDLRPVALDHLGLVAALEQFANHLNSERLSVQFKAIGFEGERLPQDLEASLYRIVQEALTNVLRHANASDVGILLERNGGRVKLFVEDDGVGFAPDQAEEGEHLGLVGMRERAEMFGGSLSVESSSESGTSILVEVPDVDSYSHRR